MDNYVEHNGCHVIALGTQKEMIESGVLVKSTSWGRYDYNNEFESWLTENLSGYYSLCGWGNGRGNHGQVDDGIWHLEVQCMRKQDAMAVKLRWL